MAASRGHHSKGKFEINKIKKITVNLKKLDLGTCFRDLSICLSFSLSAGMWVEVSDETSCLCSWGSFTEVSSGQAVKNEQLDSTRWFSLLFSVRFDFTHRLPVSKTKIGFGSTAKCWKQFFLFMFWKTLPDLNLQPDPLLMANNNNILAWKTKEAQ